MSPLEIAGILALTGWSIYQQTRRSEVTATGRFRTALVYVVIGLCVGGFDLPTGLSGYALILTSVLLSVVVGLARGRWTRVWIDSDGRTFRQGTTLTVSLFLALIVVKFALGTFAYFAHIDDGAGIGEVFLMIGVMIGVQAELVQRRARTLLRTRARDEGSSTSTLSAERSR